MKVTWLGAFLMSTLLVAACGVSSDAGANADGGAEVDALDPDVLSLSVTSPVDGTRMGAGPIVFQGTVTGIGAAVTVNTVPATIDPVAHTWRAAVPPPEVDCGAGGRTLPFVVEASDSAGSPHLAVTRTVTYDPCGPRAVVQRVDIYDERNYAATFAAGYAPCLYRQVFPLTTTLDYDIVHGQDTAPDVYKYAINLASISASSPLPGCAAETLFAPTPVRQEDRDTDGNPIHWQIQVSDDQEGPYALSYQAVTPDGTPATAAPLAASTRGYTAGSKAQIFDIVLTTATAPGIDRKAGVWSLQLTVNDAVGNAPAVAPAPIRWRQHILGGPVYVENTGAACGGTTVAPASAGLVGNRTMGGLDHGTSCLGSFVVHNGTPFAVSATASLSATAFTASGTLRKAPARLGTHCSSQPTTTWCGDLPTTRPVTASSSIASSFAKLGEPIPAHGAAPLAITGAPLGFIPDGADNYYYFDSWRLLYMHTGAYCSYQPPAAADCDCDIYGNCFGKVLDDVIPVEYLQSASFNPNVDITLRLQADVPGAEPFLNPQNGFLLATPFSAREDQDPP